MKLAENACRIEGSPNWNHLMILAAARAHPESPGLLADAYFLVHCVGGRETVDVLVRNGW